MLENFTEEVRSEVSQLREGIVDCTKTLQNLDEKIVELIASDEASSEQDITKEVEEAGKVRAGARKTLEQLDEKLNEDNHHNSVVESPSNVESMSNGSVATASKVRAKLRKL